MTVMVLILAVASWGALVLGLAGGYKSTGGAVYTASGVALTISLGGHALIRVLAARLGPWTRRLLVVLTVLLLAVVIASLASLMTLRWG